jgi:DNA helicase II / ATP-dependent DNA helicase PcrA
VLGVESDSLLAGLDDQQRAAVTMELGAPLAILAPAGSGKTRVLTRRIAWLAREGLIEPRRTLAVTFTRKAAGELVERLAALGAAEVTAGTFHALCLAQLRRRQGDRGRELPALLERKARILAPLVAGRGAEQLAAINEVAGEIEWAKARGIAPEHFVTAVGVADRELPRGKDAAQLAELYARYEREKRAKRLIDFDDLLWWCAESLETDPDFATSVRFRHRHLFVDEFQDISPAQLRVLRGWLGGRPDLCVVGDEAQAIYGFAGAEAAVLLRFDKHFPEARTVRLMTNYRSTPQVVAASNAVLGAAAGVVRPAPNATREVGAAPTVREYENDTAEAKAVAVAAQRAHDRGVPWSQIAVLYRTNAQSAAFESAFARVGIPYRLPGTGSFLARTEVKAAIAQLRKVERAVPGRRLADHLADLAAGPEAANGRDDDAASDFTSGERGASEPSDPETDAPTSELAGAFDALVRFGDEYLAAEGGDGSLAGFLAWLTAATRGEGDAGRGNDTVELVSFHRAKGLEWRVVFVTGVEQGLVPISYARTPHAKAEEQRLLHVALSRAIDELHVSWVAERVVAGRARSRKPSPWLDQLNGTSSDGESPAVDKRERLAGARARLRAQRPDAVPIDRALFDKLKEWRINTARAAEVPAFVVFNDATLEAITAAGPTTRTALLAVSGVGPTKLDRYGEAVLAIIAEHRIT